MRLATTLRNLYFTYFSKPASEKALHRLIKEHRPRKIVEIGISNLDQTLKMLEYAGKQAGGEPIRYTAIDLFDARPRDAGPLSLKECHRLLKQVVPSAQLIPGDPMGALARSANSLPGVELLLISAVHRDEELTGAWFFVPRMLASNAVVLREVLDAEGARHDTIDLNQIRQWAGTTRRRAA